MTDIEFLHAFENCSLPEEQWTHQAHVRMAWIYVRRLPLSKAIREVSEGIKRYNASLMKSLAYHETITQAFVRLIDFRIVTNNPQRSFDTFCLENPDLLDRKMAVLLTYYRQETLFSSEAREFFVSPDIIPLPIASSNPGKPNFCSPARIQSRGGVSTRSSDGKNLE